MQVKNEPNKMMENDGQKILYPLKIQKECAVNFFNQLIQTTILGKTVLKPDCMADYPQNDDYIFKETDDYEHLDSSTVCKSLHPTLFLPDTSDSNRYIFSPLQSKQNFQQWCIPYYRICENISKWVSRINKIISFLLDQLGKRKFL